MTLAARDALCSRLARVNWPEGPLLDLLGLPPDADVLDISAGEGQLLGELQARGHAGRLVGLDPRPGKGVHGGAAEALPYSAQSFDVVFLVRTLAHLTDASAGVAEARRVLRPGGRLVLACHGAEHLRETWRTLGRPASGHGPDTALRDTLTGAGLAATRLDARLPITVTAEDAAELVHASGLGSSVSGGHFPVRDALQLTAYLAALP